MTERGRAMRKVEKKTQQGRKTKKAGVRDLAVKDATAVRGGRKAGKGQESYLVVTMDNVTVSS
jgi:hypothetical protein